jgi:hypothetical protein
VQLAGHPGGGGRLAAIEQPGCLALAKDRERPAIADGFIQSAAGMVISSQTSFTTNLTVEIITR